MPFKIWGFWPRRKWAWSDDVIILVSRMLHCAVNTSWKFEVDRLDNNEDMIVSTNAAHTGLFPLKNIISLTVFEIFELKYSWPWHLIFQGHPRSSAMVSFDSPGSVINCNQHRISHRFRVIWAQNIRDLDLWPFKVIQSHRRWSHSIVRGGFPIGHQL